MLDCFNKFKSKMSLIGGSIRSEKINNSRAILNDVFEDDPAFICGVYYWKLNLDDYSKEEPIGMRMYNRKHSNANGVTVKFQTLYNNPVIVGDVLYSSEKDEYYLCTESFDKDGVNFEGELTLCNWILKWQDKNGVILNYPCYDSNTTQYNSGERFNEQITVGTSQHMIQLPADENTVILNTPQRFMLDKNTENPTTFIVTQNDNTSYNFGKKGIVKITLFEHPLNIENDRIDLGICDYFEPNIIDNQDINGLSAQIIYDSLEIKSGGDSQEYKAVFRDNGVEVTNIVPEWNIISDFNNEIDIIIDNETQTIKLSIDNDECIDEDIRLVLSDEGHTVQTSIIIRIGGLL